jgi:hypothetical protein
MRDRTIGFSIPDRRVPNEGAATVSDCTQTIPTLKIHTPHTRMSSTQPTRAGGPPAHRRNVGVGVPTAHTVLVRDGLPTPAVVADVNPPTATVGGKGRRRSLDVLLRVHPTTNTFGPPRHGAPLFFSRLVRYNRQRWHCRVSYWTELRVPFRIGRSLSVAVPVYYNHTDAGCLRLHIVY